MWNLIKKIFHRKIDYSKPNKNRKFKIGDVVLYDAYVSEPYFDLSCNTKQVIRTGILLINSFDYDADIACRCSIGKSASGTIYEDFAPCGFNYRFAQKQEIQEFINELKSNETDAHYYKDQIRYLETLI